MAARVQWKSAVTEAAREHLNSNRLQF